MALGDNAYLRNTTAAVPLAPSGFVTSVAAAQAPTLQEEANALVHQIQAAHDLLDTLLVVGQSPAVPQGGQMYPSTSAIGFAREGARTLLERLHALVNSVGQL